MAKSQKRSNREQKKPKQEKQKTAVPVFTTPGKPAANNMKRGAGGK